MKNPTMQPMKQPWHRTNRSAGPSTEDDGDDIEAMIDRHACSKVYYNLEECLGKYDRDWTKCQKEVRALKECNNKSAQAASQLSPCKNT